VWWWMAAAIGAEVQPAGSWTTARHVPKEPLAPIALAACEVDGDPWLSSCADELTWRRAWRRDQRGGRAPSGEVAFSGSRRQWVVWFRELPAEGTVSFLLDPTGLRHRILRVTAGAGDEASVDLCGWPSVTPLWPDTAVFGAAPCEAIAQARVAHTLGGLAVVLPLAEEDALTTNARAGWTHQADDGDVASWRGEIQRPSLSEVAPLQPTPGTRRRTSQSQAMPCEAESGPVGCRQVRLSGLDGGGWRLDIYDGRQVAYTQPLTPTPEGQTQDVAPLFGSPFVAVARRTRGDLLPDDVVVLRRDVREAWVALRTPVATDQIFLTVERPDPGVVELVVVDAKGRDLHHESLDLGRGIQEIVVPYEAQWPDAVGLVVGDWHGTVVRSGTQ